MQCLETSKIALCFHLFNSLLPYHFLSSTPLTPSYFYSRQKLEVEIVAYISTSRTPQPTAPTTRVDGVEGEVEAVGGDAGLQFLE